MARTGCVICKHRKVDQINERLINKAHTGESFKSIANYFKVSTSTLQNHFNAHHIGDLIAKSEDAQRVATAEQADNTFAEYQKAKGRIEDLSKKTYDLLDKAELAEDHRACVGYIREARAQEGELREQRKLLAELEGRLATQPTVNVLVNPQWIELRSLILTTLSQYPDAMKALMAALP
jgi:hypothetical protein